MVAQKGSSKNKDDEKSRSSQKVESDKYLEQEYKIAAIDKIQATAEFDMRGNFLNANENFLNIVGYNLEELRGKHHSKLVEDKYRNSRDYIDFWEGLRAGISNKGEFKRIGKGGREIWLNGFYSPILDSDGKLVKVLKYATDVTNEKTNSLDCDAKMHALDKSLAVIEFDLKGNVLNANENFLSILGYNLAEVLGKHHSMFIEDSYKHTKEYADFWENLRTGIFNAGQYKRIGKNGKEVWLQASYHPILDLNGFPYKVIKYSSDLTKQVVELKNTEDKLKQSNSELECQNQLKSAIEEISNIVRGELSIEPLCDNVLKKLAELISIKVGAFYILQNDTLELFASYAYTKRKHLSTTFAIGEGLVGQCAKEKKIIILTYVPDDYVKISSSLGEASPDAIMVMPIQFENRLLGVLEIGKFGDFSPGDQHILENSAVSIGIAINGAIGRMRLQELLQETQAQEEELRATNEEMQAQQEEMRVQQETLHKANIALEKQTDELKQIQYEIQEKKKEVEKTYEIVQQKANELEIANKYKSEFLANMSHELRTPLNSMLILSESFAKNVDGNLNEEQIEGGKIINNAGKDLLNLINDILDLSKVEAGKLDVSIKDVSIMTVFENLKRQFQPVAKHKNLEFIIENQKDSDCIIQTDQQRLEQILKNFLSNAFKFTENGSVTLGLYKPTGKLQNSNLDPHNYITIKVTDTGIGIDNNKQAIIFEAFQQVDGSISRQYGGTGLGLSISRELSKLLGYQIGLESKKGQGTSFSLNIPFSNVNSKGSHFEQGIPSNSFVHNQNKHQDSIATSSNVISEFLPNKKSFLIIVEDKELNNKYVDLVQENGYKAINVKNINDGIELARQKQPTAIIIDFSSSDANGLEVIQDLKSNPLTSLIPVYVISEEDDSSKYYQNGAIGVSKKSLDLEKLNEAFNKIDSINSGETRKVLIVEDDLKSQQVIAGLVKNSLIRITQATSGQEALDAIEGGNHFDAIVLDLGLPDMSGLSLMKALRKLEFFEIPPIIVYTGKDLNQKEFAELKKFTPSFVIKGANSDERLLDELALFLHINLIKPGQDKPAHQSTSSDKYRKLFKGRHVLLVDDDLRNTFALSGALKRYGLEVLMADNGKLAIEILENNPSIELVFMDIMMPIMDGYEAMTEIRKRPDYKNLPIIALTAKLLEEDKRKAFDCGANDFLNKPVEIEHLIETAGKWLSSYAEKNEDIRSI